MTIVSIIGVRPQFIKAAVLLPVIRKEHKEILIHTGQHYDDNMSAVFFRELGLPKPDYVLEGNDTVCTEKVRVERMTSELISVLQKETADAIMLYGDTHSTLAGVLAAEILHIPAIHVEAGERNGLGNNPEENIRKKVDLCSSLLLCCTEQAMANLRDEGLGDRARFIGNLMEISYLKNIQKPWHPHLVRLNGAFYNSDENTVITIPNRYYLLTCHRQENANDKNLTEILLAMEQAKYPVIFPVHPRNKERVLRFCSEYKLDNFLLTEPAGYFDFIHLIENAEMVVTDSGGVLQETHFAQVPYVFILDVAKVPNNTRFDVSRLAKPERKEIFDKLSRPQLFNAVKKSKTQSVLDFEKNVLMHLREFSRKAR